MARNPIDQELERIATQESEERLGPVAEIAQKYDAASSKRSQALEEGKEQVD